MNIIIFFKLLIKNPRRFCEIMLRRPAIAKQMSDETAISLLYRLRFGHGINLKTPKTFNEKLLWLTLHDRQVEYIKMVDKYEAKEWLREKFVQMGRIEFLDSIIPTYGIYNKFDEIDFNALPDSFVMKTTHDSGGVVVVQNKNDFNKEASRVKLESSLRRNYFWFSREWAYKDVEPRIIVEEKIRTKEKSPIDYKIFCFNGEAKLLYLVRDRDTEETVDYFDINFNHLPIRQVYKNNTKPVSKPECFPQMIECAEMLSKGFPFLRVDFYVDATGKFYIGELTLTPSSGLLPITPKEWDYKLGSMLNLPQIHNNVQ